MSASDNPTTSGFGDLDGNNIVVATEGRVRTDFFGFTGHQTFGTTFSNKKANSIDQRLDKDVIENSNLQIKKGSWNIYYNFDQYLYEPKKGADQGIGLFGRLGVSDGNPNFMKFFASSAWAAKACSTDGPTTNSALGITS
jgi:porin